MGCNCKKDKLELNIRKRIRKSVKEKIADVKKLWEESDKKSSGTVTVDKNKLNFK